MMKVPHIMRKCRHDAIDRFASRCPREKAAEAVERMRGKAAKAWPLVALLIRSLILRKVDS
eukprot:1160766-Pelagomonas_calceolata.AAC.3